ncbi:hypothetical protein DPSP01_009944 [Paraphaeosphaeria sporulosa]
MQVFKTILVAVAAASTAFAAPVGAADEKRDIPIKIRPNIKSIGVYAADEPPASD